MRKGCFCWDADAEAALHGIALLLSQVVDLVVSQAQVADLVVDLVVEPSQAQVVDLVVDLVVALGPRADYMVVDLVVELL